jgi:hypothetical protein
MSSSKWTSCAGTGDPGLCGKFNALRAIVWRKKNGVPHYSPRRNRGMAGLIPPPWRFRHIDLNKSWAKFAER